MPLYGTLTAMPLPDLLQWLGAARSTGTLRIERNKLSKSVHFRDGEVVGCSADDPSHKLGQFLLSRRKITEQQLSDALDLQEVTGEHLGSLLVRMGVLPEEELTAQLVEQTEEIIYSLFEWEDAVFRFHEQSGDSPSPFPVSLRVQDVLLRGLQRYDEISQIRRVFDDSGIVLRRTSGGLPAELAQDPMVRTLVSLINAERTVAEILLQAHGSEYGVTRRLYDLHRSGAVEIAEVRKVPSPASHLPVEAAGGLPPIHATAVRTPVAAAEPAAPGAAQPDLPAEDLFIDWSPEIDLGGAASPSGELGFPAGSGSLAPQNRTDEPWNDEPAGVSVTGLETLEHSEAHRLAVQFELVRKHMTEARFEEALAVLDRLYRQFPGDESLRRMTAEAEAAFVEKAYRHYLPARKIPVLTRPLKSLETDNLSPTEFFLLSRMDGAWDVKSIIQIAPIREADALRTLKQLRQNGVIELRDPD